MSDERQTVELRAHPEFGKENKRRALGSLHYHYNLGLLLARSAFGLLAAFFAGFAFLAAVRLPFTYEASGSGVVLFSVLIACIVVLLDRG
ncbi:MAG TPA: hypothetical protein VGP62_04605 [Bryobacteraceae bacterium]|jgi:hypothetical protein|nr:hypothetical protein [Bryobacteraceae bacterium]